MTQNYWEHGHLNAVQFIFHLCLFCYTLTWQHSDFHKLSCCLSHRRTLARQWPAASQRPLPTARRGQVSWHCPAGGFWCWKIWTRSMCPTWAENEDTIKAWWLLRAKRGLAWSSPYERCCPQHWTSCCFPVCPSGWSRAGRKVWAGCRTVWRTSSTPRCMLWATPCRPDDSTRAETETNTGKHIWRLKMSKLSIEPPHQMVMLCVDLNGLCLCWSQKCRVLIIFTLDMKLIMQVSYCLCLFDKI